MVLPRLGGTPAVWNTCMVFFQAALLLGYGYAHLTQRFAKQPLLHVFLLLAPWAVLPLAVPESWTPSVERSPVPSLLALLAWRVGLPFFVLATSGPLLQSWFARTGEKDPYYLYAASNTGSMIGLLGYPLVLEPFLPLQAQSRVWSGGYLVLVILTAGCAAIALRARAVSEKESEAAKPLGRGRVLRWIALAAVPSAQMLGVTTYMTTDVAAAPLLWVVPLALYLLSFILAFARSGARLHPLWVAAMPFGVLGLAGFIALGARDPLWTVLGLHLGAFFVVAMVCHGELAKDRPPASQLTAYYFAISIGGLVGGTLTSLVAPLVFKDVTEYPLALVFACALAPERKGGDRQRDFLYPIGLFALTALFAIESDHIYQMFRRALVLGLPLFVAFTFSRRPVRFALGVAAILVGVWVPNIFARNLIHEERSFFGVHRLVHEEAVVDSKTIRFRSLSHGTTRHGRQRENDEEEPALPREPLTYYSRPGPIGQAIAALVSTTPGKRVGVVGLGSGTIAAYAEPGQSFTYFEIDPAVVRIAETYFTYLRAAKERGASVKIVLGDARLTLARSEERFDLLAIDAFSSDAIPLHLMTREAIAQAYLPRLAPHGALFFHISNRYLDLAPILGDLAGDAGLVCCWRKGKTTDREGHLGYTDANWVALARDWADLGSLAEDARWERIAPRTKPIVWTDGESNILSALSH